MLRAELRRRRRLTVLAIALGALAVASTARAGPVSVVPAAAGAAQVAACEAVIGRLPTRLDRRSRRPVTPSTGVTAAWGRPAITLSCGLAPDARPVSAQEVCLGSPAGGCEGAVRWYLDPFDPTLWKTRAAPLLAVHVPAADGLADVLAPISAALAGSRPGAPLPGR